MDYTLSALRLHQGEYHQIKNAERIITLITVTLAYFAAFCKKFCRYKNAASQGQRKKDKP